MDENMFRAYMRPLLKQIIKDEIDDQSCYITMTKPLIRWFQLTHKYNDVTVMAIMESDIMWLTIYSGLK